MTDTVKDVDVIATATDPLALGRAAAELDLVEEAGTASAAGVRLRMHTGAVDLGIVEPDQFGNLLQHLTGSKEHNMALRDVAVRKGLHVSEYGVVDDATGETHRCATEHEVYALLGLEYIEPELRENRGELEAAAAGTLPKLIVPRTSAATCTRTRPRRTAPPRSRRWRSRRAISATSIWRSPIIRRASGSATRSRLNGCASRSPGSVRRIDGIELLAGSEVNILPDGSLDYPDELLDELDWVIASVHSSFRMSSDAMTERIVRAIEHPLVDAIGHCRDASSSAVRPTRSTSNG